MAYWIMKSRLKQQKCTIEYTREDQPLSCEVIERVFTFAAKACSIIPHILKAPIGHILTRVEVRIFSSASAVILARALKTVSWLQTAVLDVDERWGPEIAILLLAVETVENLVVENLSVTRGMFCLGKSLKP